MPARAQELADNLSAVRQRIGAAAEAAGRDPDDIALIAVTKFFPVTDAALLADLGQLDLGESRDQEAAAKVRQLSTLTRAPVRWHFVGRLQTNKAASVARYADVVHSVDRPSLVAALGRGAAHASRTIGVLIQVSPDADPDRGGALTADVPALVALIGAQPSLRLDGVMAVAPLDADPGAAFAALAEVSASLRSTHPEATVVSAGMSADLEAAIAHGATHVRIGTALLGPRSGSVG